MGQIIGIRWTVDRSLGALNKGSGCDELKDFRLFLSQLILNRTASDRLLILQRDTPGQFD